MKKLKFITVLNASMLFILIIIFPLFAQDKAERLIFSEVFLDENNPDNNWVMIYNPTNEPLILESFRISHVKTPNVLSNYIEEQGEIVIKSKKYLILCANRKQFKARWNTKKNKIVTDVLTNVDKGGFLQLNTKDMGKEGIDAIRYGVPEYSDRFIEFCGTQVLKFPEDGKSYVRQIIKKNGTVIIGNFIESIPTLDR